MKWLLALCLAQEPDVDRLVRDLGSEHIETRDRAAIELEHRGATAFAALEKAGASDDAEIAARAKAILVRIRVTRFSRPVIERIDNPFWPFGRADEFQMTPDAKIAVGRDLDNVHAWSVPDGRLIHVWRPHARGVSYSIQLSREGTQLTRSSRMRWRSGSSRPGSPSVSGRRRPSIGRLASCRAGDRLMATARDGGKASLVLFDPAADKIVRRYHAFDGYIAGVAVDPAGSRVVASGRDGPLAAWDVETGRKLWEEARGANARWLQFAPDGQSLMAGDDAGRIRRHAADSGAILATYRESGGRISRGAIDPRGERFIAIGDAGEPLLFDLASGRLLRTLKGRPYYGAAFLDGGRTVVTSGPVAMFACGRDGVFRLGSDTLKPLDSLPLRAERGGIDVDPAGGLLLTPGFVADSQGKARAIEWSYPAGGEFRRKGAQLPGAPLAAFFSRDGSRIFVVTRDGLVITLRPGD